MINYSRLERPVQNDSAPIVVELGLTLLQIIDVVSVCACACFGKAKVWSKEKRRMGVEFIWKPTQRLSKRKLSWTLFVKLFAYWMFFRIFHFVCVKGISSDLSTANVEHANAHTSCLLHFIVLWTKNCFPTSGSIQPSETIHLWKSNFFVSLLHPFLFNCTTGPQSFLSFNKKIQSQC